MEEIVPLLSARVAEAATRLETIYPSINAALVNELRLLVEYMASTCGRSSTLGNPVGRLYAARSESGYRRALPPIEPC